MPEPKLEQAEQIVSNDNDALDADFATNKTLMSKLKSWRHGWGERWALLHANQAIYVIALVLFFTADGNLEEPGTQLWLIGFLALFAMARELWAIFVKVWESTFGRLVLFVLYAAIANFTLALAAQKVNIVIGADPSYLYHTQGLTMLLMLPLWLMLVSMVAIVCIFGILQFLRLIKGILVSVRIIASKSKPKEAFPKTFNIIRLILLAPVIVTIVNSLSWYSEQLHLDDTFGGFYISSKESNEARILIAQKGIETIDEELKNLDLENDEREELLQAKAKLEAALQARTNRQAEELATEESEPLVKEDAEEKTYILDGFIASFVYHYEAFKFSHCEKTPAERVVYISENEILVVKKNDKVDSGYDFSTRTCVVAQVDSGP